MEKYIEKDYSFIVKKNGQFYYEQREARHGVVFTALVNDPHTKYCHECIAYLQEMKEDEKWIVMEDYNYFCPPCGESVLSLDDTVIERFPDATMPRRIDDLVLSIERHPDYGQVNKRTKIMISVYRDRNDNKELRSLWSFLYKGI